MALPVTFATLQAGNQQLSLLDTQFAAVGALGSIPCAAAGTNAITLTPNSNTPTVSSYTDLAPSFIFAAAQTSSGAVTLNVNGIGARNAYKWNGLVGVGAFDLVAGMTYKATFLTALNSGAGGFVVDCMTNPANLVADIALIIDGGGNPITTGQKGQIHLPFALAIQSWKVMADQSGSISIDVLRANDAVPVTSIVGAGNKPTLTAQQFAEVVVSGWTSQFLVKEDWIAFNVVSAATVTRVNVTLICNKE